MPVKDPARLTLKDHEALSLALLRARAYLAQTSATVREGCSWRWSKPLAHILAVAIRQVDEARDRLAAVAAAEHAHLHPAFAKRLYYPLVGQPEGGLCRERTPDAPA